MKCGDLDAAKLFQGTKDALSVKRIGDKIQSNEQWNDTCENVMIEIIESICFQIQMKKMKIGLDTCVPLSTIVFYPVTLTYDPFFLKSLTLLITFEQ